MFIKSYIKVCMYFRSFNEYNLWIKMSTNCANNVLKIKTRKCWTIRSLSIIRKTMNINKNVQVAFRPRAHTIYDRAAYLFRFSNNLFLLQNEKKKISSSSLFMNIFYFCTEKPFGVCSTLPLIQYLISFSCMMFRAHYF